MWQYKQPSKVNGKHLLSFMSLWGSSWSWLGLAGWQSLLLGVCGSDGRGRSVVRGNPGTGYASGGPRLPLIMKGDSLASSHGHSQGQEWAEIKCFSQASACITFAIISVAKAKHKVSPNVRSGERDCAASVRGTTKSHGKCSLYRKE